MRKPTLTTALVFVGLTMVAAIVYGQRRSSKKVVRARPPEWSREVIDLFATDARDKLVGERPAFGTLATARPTPGGGAGPSSSSETSAGGVFAWSKLIAPETLEDEVKAQKLLVDETIDVPGKFKGGGNREARKQFSMLAVAFAIIGEYDGDVRWQKDAPGLRDLFAQAGFSCKVGTTQAFNQAKLRKQDLADLVRGGSIAAVKPAEATAQWDKVTNRPPLMNRMEESFQKRLRPWLASEDAFKKNTENVYHEAQILAALSEVIQREGFEYWDDETYLDYAKRMRQASLDIVDAVKLNSYDKANSAAGEISKACSECHEGYRG